MFCFTPQVTHGKGDLEKGLKLAKKFEKDIKDIEEFMQATDQSLSEREAVNLPRDMQEEIEWIQVRWVL